MRNKSKLAVFASIFIALLVSCKTSNMGTKKTNADGSVTETTKKKCAYPQKTYAKGLDAKVKLSVDSLSAIPVKSLEAGLTQTVIHLSDYTSEGLDRDLLLFRICEMANNRGLTAEQTQTLMSQAISQWDVTTELKKKSDTLKK
jgi:hypothetical protein